MANQQVATPEAKKTRLDALKVPAIIVVAFVALLWVIEIVDSSMHHRLDRFGIEPRETEGLRGIAFGPLLHANWDHLISNSVPALILGFIALVATGSRFFAATAIIWVVSGVGTWLTADDHTVVVGFSGVIFGWMTFLLVRGFFNRSGLQILVALVVFVIYGGILWGVLPGQSGISWQGHLFGAIGGVIAAALLAPKRERQPDAAG